MMLEREGKTGNLFNASVFLFTNNSTVEACLYKGTPLSSKLFDLVVRTKLLETKYQCRLFVSHIAGTRMMSQGTDGISRGNMSEGVLDGEDMLSFIPLNEGAVERHDELLTWIKSWLGFDAVIRTKRLVLERT